MTKCAFLMTHYITVVTTYITSDRKPTQTGFCKKGKLLIYVMGKFRGEC